jgi:hypothetical protein
MAMPKTVPRSALREADERCDHIEIFREFLDRLSRASRGRNDKGSVSEEMRTNR